jgi:ribulose-bisphosphate carboxylase large chain
VACAQQLFDEWCLVVGTILKPKLGLQPKPFGEACYALWQGGECIKNDEPQGNQVVCQMNECIPVVDIRA